MRETVAVEALDDQTVDRARARAAAAGRVVVKAGTNSLTDEDSRLDRVKLDKLVTDIMDLRDRGTDVVLVSSGAVGAGTGLLGADVGQDPNLIEESQALSTVGQGHLMRHYTQSFERYDQRVAQILLTGKDLDTPERFRNFTNTVETLLEWGVVPIINENDAVATEELRIGDNDMLSASVAIGLDVELLVTLTDVGGVYTGNPKRNPDAELIDAVGANYESVLGLVDESTTAAFGGIQTKFEGARDVSECGIPAIIAGSADPDVLDRIAEGESVGTIFVPMDGETDD
ncbi:glutamate 5-kinase [Natronomonas moolapensis 8.8.11]|uniref:Glutamate 5-kinase n=1 Tax=Natronomonas moolapensis (strain DSM 18674 / CECT 7526 / JCM 14361 / 8.8.11) TaxID=268739 RepID=M1XU35_NATM8|nr:glutamate 5-kinase [Natronomonas moolapensis]CCQ37971.1 glutamate 5-kinase [Natronomonas moolapensis 8.8.11]